MALSQLLEQLPHLLRNRRRMGGLKLMDRAVKQLDGLNTLQNAGIGPLELRLQRRDLRGEGRQGRVTDARFLAVQARPVDRLGDRGGVPGNGLRRGGWDPRLAGTTNAVLDALCPPFLLLRRPPDREQERSRLNRPHRVAGTLR